MFIKLPSLCNWKVSDSYLPMEKVPFMFQVDYFTKRAGMNIQFCDIKRDYQHAYFLITMTYIMIIMFVPIILIFLSNTFIINRILHANRQREKMFLESFTMTMSTKDSHITSLHAVERELKTMKRASDAGTLSSRQGSKKFSVDARRIDEIDDRTIDTFVKQANSITRKTSQVCQQPTLGVEFK